MTKLVVYKLGRTSPVTHTRVGKDGRRFPIMQHDPIARAQSMTSAAEGAVAVWDFAMGYFASLAGDTRKKAIMERNKPRIDALLQNRPEGSGVIFEYRYASDPQTKMEYVVGGGVMGVGDTYNDATCSMARGDHASIVAIKPNHANWSEYLWIKKEGSGPKTAARKAEKQDPARSFKTSIDHAFDAFLGPNHEDDAVLRAQMEETHPFFSKDDLKHMRALFEARQKTSASQMQTNGR